MSATNYGNTNHAMRTLRVGELCEAIEAGEIHPRQRDGCYYISSRDIERLTESRRERDIGVAPDVYDFNNLPEIPDLHVSSLA